jgi:hypothetical protein
MALREQRGEKVPYTYKATPPPMQGFTDGPL